MKRDSAGLMLSLLLLAGVVPGVAQADVLAVRRAANCAEAGFRLTSYEEALERYRELTPAEKLEILEVETIACSGKFKDCDLDFCKRVAEVVGKSGEGSYNIVRDPLQWLEAEMSCEDFKEQVQSRYAPLGSFADLPVEKQRELQKVLSVACEERFAHCNFSNCKTSEGEEKPPAGKDMVVSSEDFQKARTELNTLVAEYFRERQKKIRTAETEERRRGIAWTRFTVETGERQLRRAPKERPDRAPSKGRPSQRSQSSPNRSPDASKKRMPVLY